MADEEASAPERAEGSGPPAPQTSLVTMWRRRGIAICLIAVAAALVTHAEGGERAAMIGGAVVVLLVIGLVLRHLPSLRKHFNEGRRPPRPRGGGGGLLRRAPRGARAPRLARGAMARPGMGRSGRPRGGAPSRLMSGGRATGARRAGPLGGSGPRRAGGSSGPRRGGPFAGSPARSRSGWTRGTARSGGSAARRGGTWGGPGLPWRGRRGPGSGTGPRGRGGRRSGAPGTGARGSARRRAGAFRTPRARRRGGTGGYRSRGYSRPTGRRAARGYGRRGPWGAFGRRRSMPPPRGRSRRPRGYGRPGTPRSGGSTRVPNGTRATGAWSTPPPRSRWRRAARAPFRAARFRRRARAGATTRPIRVTASHPRVRAMGRRYRRARTFVGKSPVGRAARRFHRKKAATTRRRGVRRVLHRMTPAGRKAAAARRLATTRRLRATGIRGSLLSWRRIRVPGLRSWRRRSHRSPRGPATYTVRPPRHDSHMPRPAPAPAGHREPFPAQPPFTTPAASPSSGGTRTMAGRITQAGEELTAALAAYDPGNLDQLEGIFPDLKEVFDGVARGLNGLSAKYGDELPVKPVVAEAIAEIAAACAGLSAAVDEAHGTFMSAHEDEINRIRNPRPNEQVWDTTSNR